MCETRFGLEAHHICISVMYFILKINFKYEEKTSMKNGKNQENDAHTLLRRIAQHSDGWMVFFVFSLAFFFLPLSVHLLFWCSPASLCFIEYGRISVPVAFFIITLVACICKAFERRLQRCLLHSVSSRASRRAGVGIVCNG